MALDRRDFIKFVIGGAIGSLFTPIPWKLADDISIWTQNWPWIPRLPKGELTQKSSVVKMGNTPYGAVVNLVGKNPYTISGNRENPLSRGGIDPVGAASVSLRYSPSRILSPKIKKGSGNFEDISYDETKKILLKHLLDGSKKRDSIIFVSGDDTSSCNEIFSSVLKKLNSSLYFYSPSDRQKYFKAWYDILNGNGEVGFDIENSDCILVLGCNVLDNWGTPLRNQRIFGNNNPDIYFVGPYKNNTSTVAKGTYFVSERDLYKFVFGVINYLINSGFTPPQLSGMNDFIKFISSNYNIKDIAKEISCLPSDIKDVALALQRARRPLVIAGSLVDGSGSIKNIVAGLILNIFLGRINKKGGVFCIPNPPTVIPGSISHQDILKNDLIEYCYKKSKGPDIALFYGTNPMYCLPKEIKDYLKEIPFKVCFSLLMDETARTCDLIIPLTHFLERLDDCFTPFGSSMANYCVSDKVVEPLNHCKDAPDIFLDIAKSLGGITNMSSYMDIIKTKAEYLGMKIEDLLTGKTWTDSTYEFSYGLKIWDSNMENMFSKKQNRKPENVLELTPINNSKTGTDITGLLPFSMDILYEDELPKKGMYAYMHPDTSKKFHIKEKDEVKLKTGAGLLHVKIKIDPSIRPGNVAILYGLGREIDDSFNKDKGQNICNLFEIEREDEAGSYCWASNMVSISKI